MLCRYIFCPGQLLLCVSAKKTLRLTKIDNDIYDKFRSEFAEMKVDELDVEFVKSTQGKEVRIDGRLANFSLWVCVCKCCPCAVYGVKAMTGNENLIFDVHLVMCHCQCFLLHTLVINKQKYHFMKLVSALPTQIVYKKSRKITTESQNSTKITG